MHEVPSPGQILPSWDTEAVQALADLREDREVRDAALDRLYPDDIRKLSSRFWTPVSVCRLAARLLTAAGPTRVLDVGAGVGRFCLVGALSCEEGTFVGIEHRQHLVDAGRAVLAAAGVTRAELLQGTLDDIDIERYGGLYFYNPFEENLLPAEGWHIDESVTLSEDRFRKDVAQMEALLAAARPGMRVVTYQGFGGTMPSNYRLVHDGVPGSPYLRLWVKGEEPAEGPGTPDKMLFR
jgi:hypothetical protein